MTEQRVVFPEWRAQHEPTKYPFADVATLVNSEGDFLPETVFLDASFYPIGGTDHLYLSRVVVDHETAELFIGDANTVELASATFDILTPPDVLRFIDAYGRPAGLMVSEASRLVIFQSWTPGTHDFDPEATEFAARCCVPTPAIGVRGFLLADGSVLTGDVWMVGDAGVVLSVEESGNEHPGCIAEDELLQVIRVDIVGDPLFRRRLCQGSFTTPNFLSTLAVKHGCTVIECGPDEFGNVSLTVGSQDAPDTILRIRAVGQRVIFEAVGERLQAIR